MEGGYSEISTGEKAAPSAQPSGRLLARSAFMAVAVQWAIRLIGLVSVVALARLLDPEDFGLVAIALTAAGLVELFGWLGIGQALLRVREPEREHYDTAFTIQFLVFSSLAAVMVALVAPAAAAFYGLPELQVLLSVLAVRFLCIATVNIGVLDFERNFEFVRDLKMRVGARLAALIVTVAAAFLLRNHWALIVGLIAQSAFHTLATYIAHPFRPRLSLAKRRELLGTSLWVFASTMADWLQNNIERLVLGRFTTTYALGLFSTSKDLAMIFTHEVSIALNRVTFVTVAGTDAGRGPPPFATILGAYALVAAPLAAGLAASAEDAVAVFLGAKWLAAAPFLQIIAIYTGVQAVYSVVAAVLQASGRARLAAGLSISGALLTAAAVVAAALLRGTAEAVALSALAASLVMLFCYAVMLARASASRLWPVLSHVLRPALAAAAMLLAVIFIADPDSGSPLLDLLVSVALGAPVYAVGLLTIWLLAGRPDGPETRIFAVLRRYKRSASALSA